LGDDTLQPHPATALVRLGTYLGGLIAYAVLILPALGHLPCLRVSVAMFRELVRELVQLEGERLATFLTASARRSFVKNASSSLCPESRGASGAQFERVFLSTARASVPL
jgi:hypothetical protein